MKINLGIKDLVKVQATNIWNKTLGFALEDLNRQLDRAYQQLDSKEELIKSLESEIRDLKQAVDEIKKEFDNDSRIKAEGNKLLVKAVESYSDQLKVLAEESNKEIEASKEDKLRIVLIKDYLDSPTNRKKKIDVIFEQLHTLLDKKVK